ncbi:MAG: hypothetical protein JWP55_3276 [Mycobacterium sp.]|nr:hypothetical protein [Mycobacterium sp.]
MTARSACSACSPPSSWAPNGSSRSPTTSSDRSWPASSVTRRPRRRLPRRRPARRRTVLQPRPPARRARTGTPLPARPHRPHLEARDRPRQGLRPHPAARPNRRGLQGDGRTPRNQDTATALNQARPSRHQQRRQQGWSTQVDAVETARHSISTSRTRILLRPAESPLARAWWRLGFPSWSLVDVPFERSDDRRAGPFMGFGTFPRCPVGRE